MSPKGQHLCGHTGGTDLEVRLAAIATVAAPSCCRQIRPSGNRLSPERD